MFYVHAMSKSIPVSGFASLFSPVFTGDFDLDLDRDRDLDGERDGERDTEWALRVINLRINGVLLLFGR